MQFLPPYILLFYMLLNDNNVNVEKPDGIFSPNFDVDEF